MRRGSRGRAGLVEGNPGQPPAIDAVALVEHRAEVLGKLRGARVIGGGQRQVGPAIAFGRRAPRHLVEEQDGHPRVPVLGRHDDAFDRQAGRTAPSKMPQQQQVVPGVAQSPGVNNRPAMNSQKAAIRCRK